MTTYNSLPRPQQDVLSLVLAGNPVPRFLNSSARALERQGAILRAPDQQNNQWFALTDVGKAIFDEYLYMAHQTTQNFHEGDPVLWLKWGYGYPNTVEWVKGAVQKVGHSMITVQLDDGTEIQRRPTSLKLVKDTPEPPARKRLSFEFKEMETFEQLGETWHAVIQSKKTTWGDFTWSATNFRTGKGGGGFVETIDEARAAIDTYIRERRDLVSFI